MDNDDFYTPPEAEPVSDEILYDLMQDYAENQGDEEDIQD